MAEKAKVDIEIRADDKASAKLKKLGLSADGMSKNFRKAGLAMAAMGAGLVIGLGKMVNSYSKAGDEVAKMAKRTGFGTVALSELRHVAEITGTELGSIEKATKKMSKTIVDAGDGLETAARSFEKLGLNVEALRAMQPEQQFWTIADAIGDLEDHALKAAMAQDVFGKSGTDLLPMMEETGEGIALLRDEAHKLNVVFSEDAAKAAEDFEDAKGRLQKSFKGLMTTIAEKMMPHIEDFITKVKDIVTKITEWAKEHPKLTDAIAKFGLALTALCVVGGPMLLVVGYVDKMVKGFLVLRTALLTSVIPALVKATLAFIAMLATMGPLGWAALLGGIAAAGAAIAGLAGLGLLGGGEKKAFPPPPGGGEYGGAPTPPSMQYGGIVPGRIGQPVPVMAHGGERFLGPGGMGGGVTLVVNYQPTFGLADESKFRSLADKLQEYLRENMRRTYRELT